MSLSISFTPVLGPGSLPRGRRALRPPQKYHLPWIIVARAAFTPRALRLSLLEELLGRTRAGSRKKLLAWLLERAALSLCRCCPRECSLRHNRQVRPSPGLPTLCTPVGAGKLEQVHSASVVLLLHFFAPRRLESTQCSIVARELSAEGGQHDDRWCCLQPVECNGHRRCGRMRQAKTR